MNSRNADWPLFPTGSQAYNPLAKELFNAAFVSCWMELKFVMYMCICTITAFLIFNSVFIYSVLVLYVHVFNQKLFMSIFYVLHHYMYIVGLFIKRIWLLI